MTRDEFLFALQKELKKVSETERRDAMEYYAEYFDEAGPEEEQRVIQELGTPRQLAAKIKAQNAMRQAEADPKSGRKSIHAVWVGIGAAFAAPIAIPIALALAIVVIALLIVLFALIFSFFAIAFALAAAGVAVLIAGGITFFYNPPTALLFVGGALFCAGLAGLFLVPTVAFSRFCFGGLARLVNKRILKK